jgi:hypothetical protein
VFESARVFAVGEARECRIVFVKNALGRADSTQPAPEPHAPVKAEPPHTYDALSLTYPLALSLSLTLPLGNYTLRRPSAKCVLCFRHFTLDESQPQITHKFKPFSARQETNKMNPTFVMMLRHVKLTNNEYRYNHREN